MRSCAVAESTLTMARWLIVRCCVVVGAYWLTSSAPVSGLSDVIEYRLVEGSPASTLVGNVPVDAGLHTMYTAQTLTSFRYRLLPTDGDTGKARVSLTIARVPHPHRLGQRRRGASSRAHSYTNYTEIYEARLLRR